MPNATKEIFMQLYYNKNGRFTSKKKKKLSISFY